MPKFEEAIDHRQNYGAAEDQEAKVKEALKNAANLSSDELMELAQKKAAAEKAKKGSYEAAANEAFAEQEGRVMDEAKAEDAERKIYDEAKAEDEVRTETKLNEIRERIKSESAEEKTKPVTLEDRQKETKQSQEKSVEELPVEAQQVIDKMKNQGLYENELSILKPGEIPAPELISRMISTVFNSGFDLKDAEALMKLPLDSALVKKYAVKDIMENLRLNDRNLKILEIAGIDTSSLHDEAVEKLPSILYLVAGEKGQYSSPESVKKWKQTFSISEQEYAKVLHEFWKSRNGNISQEHLTSLGFLKQRGGKTSWAWEN